MSSAEQGKETQDLTLQFLDEVERCEFTEAEKEVVLAPMRFRPSKVIETKGGEFSSPEEWSAALEAAHQSERRSYRELHEQHGFPDTEEMNPQEGHFARLAHLMKKHPAADWRLLMQGQDTAMSRKPSPPVARKLTIQDIERDKAIYLAQVAERDRILTEGEAGAVAPLQWVLRTIQRKERQLISYGVNVQELLEGHTPEVADSEEPKAYKVVHVAYENGEEHPPTPQEILEQGSEAAALTVRPAETTSEEAQPVSGAAVIGVNEIAQRLGRSAGTVREYLQQSRIPGAIQTGGRWTVNRDAFEEWLKGKPATIPSANEVRKAVQATRPKWDNGDFKPSF